ncbi:MAG: extracellular solute-binding protein [Anaerolineae bacterium]|nr:extracellular solute-binding protein [Anaerolineae bacterium]
MKKLLIRLMPLVVLFSILISCRTDDTDRSGITETTTITLAGFPAFQQAYETLAQRFQEQYPTIAMQYIPLDEQAGSLSLPERASLADVLLLHNRPPSEAAASFLDLEPVAAVDTVFDGNDFWPGLMDACQAGGIQISLPLSVNVDLIFYDKAAFDGADLPYPHSGWDWLAFQQTAQLLTTVDRYGFIDTGRPLSLLGPLVDHLLLINNSLNSDQLATELDWYVSFVQEGVISTPADDLQTTVTNRNTLINNRRAAMWLGSQFELSQWQTAFGDNLGVVSFPTTGGMAASNPARPTCAAISAGTTQAQAAWNWVHFLSTQAPITFQSDVPARPSVAQSSGYWEQMKGETAASLRRALERGWYGSDTGQQLAAVNDAILQAIASETALADNLPATIDRQPTAIPPTPDSATIAVATPSTVSTPVALPGSSIPTDNVIIVDYYSGDSGHRNLATLTALADAFNEAQNSIEVKLNAASGGVYITDRADNYDCFASEGWASHYAVVHSEFRDKFYSLDPLLAGEDTAFIEDFNSNSLEVNRVGGELFGLPVAFSPFVIRYNAGLFSELGLEPPSPDWTIDDFWALAVSASRNEEDRKIYGFVPGVAPRFLSNFAPEAGPLYDPDSWPPEANFAEPATIATLTWLAGVVEAGILFPSDWGGSRTAGDYRRAQVQQEQLLINLGQAAMWIFPAGLRTDYYQFEPGVAPFPSSVPIPETSTTSLYISRRATNPLGCWEWFKFLSAQPDAFSGIPVRHTVLDSAGWRAVVGNETAAAYQVILSRLTFPLPGTPGKDHYLITQPYEAWFVDALQEVYAGASPTAVLEEMQRRADAYLTCIVTLAAEVNEYEQVINCARQVDPEFQE